MAVTSTVTFTPSFAEQNCDALLVAAGLHPRWMPAPDRIPQSLRRMSMEVLAMAGQQRLDRDDQQFLRDFGKATANYIPRVFDTDTEGHYRTAGAIKYEDGGNCMAAHEAVSGILSACGLGDYAFGQWQNKFRLPKRVGHASTGLLIGDQMLHIDGYWPDVELVPQDQADIELWHDLMEYDRALVTSMGNFTSKPNAIAIELTDMNTVDISFGLEGNTKSIIASAASAILIYSSVVKVGLPDTARNRHAQNVLEPFAPVL